VRAAFFLARCDGGAPVRYLFPMLRAIAASLVLLAACGKTDPYPCAAVVTGTGATADGTYECKQPAQGQYTPSSGTGQFSGFGLGPNGMQFTFSVSFPGEPVTGTFTESTLPQGAVAVVAIVGKLGSPLWEPGSFTLTVRELNNKNIYPYTLSEVWPEVRGTLTATLKPAAGNPATTNASVSMNF